MENSPIFKRPNFSNPKHAIGIEVGEGAEFKVSEFLNNPNFVVKRINFDKEKGLLPPELSRYNLIDLAQQKYVRSYQLMRKYLGDFVPRARVLIGKQGTSEEDEIFIVQQKIQGNIYGSDSWLHVTANLINHANGGVTVEELKNNEIGDVDKDFLKKVEEVDDLVFRALKMWDETSSLDAEDLPLGITADAQVRKKEKGEGFFPEITSEGNLMWGSKMGKEHNQLFVVDNGLICVPPWMMFKSNDFSGGIKMLMSMRQAVISLIRDRQNNPEYIPNHPFFAEQDKFIEWLQKSKSLALYNQLSEKYGYGTPKD